MVVTATERLGCSIRGNRRVSFGEALLPRGEGVTRFAYHKGLFFSLFFVFAYVYLLGLSTFNIIISHFSLSGLIPCLPIVLPWLNIKMEVG